MHILLKEYYRRYRNVWNPEAEESYLEKKFLEVVFWDVLQILKRENTIFDLQPQFPFKCRENKTRRVDFVYRIGNWSIAFELDGRTKLERENRTLNRDAFNDLIRRQNDLLNVVDDLLRFTYDDIHFNKDKCVKIIVERCRKYINQEKIDKNVDLESRLEEKLKIFAEHYSKNYIEEIKQILISQIPKEKETVAVPEIDVPSQPYVSYKKYVLLMFFFLLSTFALSVYYFSNASIADLLHSNTELADNDNIINSIDNLERIYTRVSCLSASSYLTNTESLLCGQGKACTYNHVSNQVTDISTILNVSENVLSCFYSKSQEKYYLGLDNGQVIVNGKMRHELYPQKHVLAINEAHSNQEILLSIKHHGIVRFDIVTSSIVDSLLFSSNIYAILKGQQPNQYFLGDANGQLIIADYLTKTNQFIHISDNPIRAISFAGNQETLFVGDNAGNLYAYNLSKSSNAVLVKSFSRPILHIDRVKDMCKIILEGGIIYQTEKL